MHDMFGITYCALIRSVAPLCIYVLKVHSTLVYVSPIDAHCVHVHVRLSLLWQLVRNHVFFFFLSNGRFYWSWNTSTMETCSSTFSR